MPLLEYYPIHLSDSQKSTISGEAQRKRRLCIRTGLQYKLLCLLAIELEASHEGGDAGQSL